MKKLGKCFVVLLCVAATLSIGISSEAIAGGGGGECEGDANGDGVVNIVDFLAVLFAFGDDCSQEPCDEDVDGDGMVGIGDFLTVLANFGCGLEGCETHEDCDDGDDCTFDLCIFGTCLNIPICD